LQRRSFPRREEKEKVLLPDQKRLYKPQHEKGSFKRGVGKTGAQETAPKKKKGNSTHVAKKRERTEHVLTRGGGINTGT